MKTVRLGIIGLGYIGQIHLRHALRIPNLRVVAVSDQSKKALAKVKGSAVRKTYINYENLLEDPEVDAVIIALPIQLHLQCSKQAAEAGKDIFLEKPMARNIEEAKEIISTAQDNNIKLMMGYPYRFSQSFRNLKTDIEKGVLGDVEIAYATFMGSGPFMHRAEGYTPIPVPEWWFKKELTGGGVLVDLGSHLINLLRWYFGEVTDIKSHLTHRFNLDIEDGAVCIAKFETGTVGIISVGWFSQAHKLAVECFGSVNHGEAQQAPSSNLSTAAQMLFTGTSKFYQAHYSELQYFVNCIIKNLNPSPSAQDGLRDLEVISQAYKNRMRLNLT